MATGFSISIDKRDLDELSRDIPIAAIRLENDVKEEQARVGAIAFRVARDEAPVFQGGLRAGIRLDPPVIRIGGGASIVGGGFEIVSTLRTTTPPRDVVMEEGRRPGKTGPPLDAIATWIRLKAARGEFTIPSSLGERPDRALMRAAFILSRSISRKGTSPRHFIRKAENVAAVEMFRRLNALVEIWANRYERNAF